MVKVKCLYIDNVHIAYECPFCWKVGKSIKGSPFMKNGKPYKTAKPNIHRHGSCGGKVGNGLQHRVAHCTFSKESVEIEITNETPRETPYDPLVVHFE
jgi:hypothetical protein